MTRTTLVGAPALGLLIATFSGGGGLAQSGERVSFDLELIREGDPGFDADPIIEGSPGSEHVFSANVLIVQSGYEEEGVQGWSFGLWHSNLDLLSITTDGTVLADKKDGGLFDTGLQVYKVLDPAANAGKQGVIQAAVLSLFRTAFLPNARNIVGRNVYSARVPEGGAGAFIVFNDRLRVEGSPDVSLNATARGQGVPVVLRGREIALGVRVPPETDCADSMDNDRDGWTDCKDPQCSVLAECGGEVCGDGMDNDGDRAADCKDSDCLPGSCYEECNDGMDNNGDGLADCDDPACIFVSPCRIPEVCDDGIDNDRDGRADCKDPQCDFIGDCPGPEVCGDNLDNDLDGILDCDDPQCVGIHPCVGFENCQNGQDDNGDGKVDCDDFFCMRFNPCRGDEICDDGVDNDLDRLTDCDDPQCAGVGACPSIEICNDGIDNDKDGDTDCLDSRCLGIPPCFGPEVCRDRLDNDGDGMTDCRDPDCLGDEGCPRPEVCDDGIDNDGDLRIDCDDADCRSRGDCPPAEICNDSVDNDSDGAVDCLDPDCEPAQPCAPEEGFDMVVAADGPPIEEGGGMPGASPAHDRGIPVTVYVVPFPGPQSHGAQGWSLSVQHDRDLLGFDPDGGAPTTAGTDAEKVFAGGFVTTQIGKAGSGGGAGDGEDPGDGFISAVVLSLTQPAELDPSRAQSVARARYVLTRPFEPGMPAETQVRLVDGLRGASSLPVRNLLTIEGRSVEPLHLVSLTIRLSGDTRFVRGDANGDERVNLADAVWCINELVRRGREAPCHRAADLNADGRYNLSDPMFLIQWLFLSGPAIPEPFPRCGTGVSTVSPTLECPEGSVPHCGA